MSPEFLKMGNFGLCVFVPNVDLKNNFKSIIMKKIFLLAVYFCVINFTNGQSDYSNDKELSFFEEINFKIGAGVFIPNGNLKDYFGASPVIEMSFGFPFNLKKSTDVVFQFGIPTQDKNFQFIRNIDTVAAKTNMMFNAFLKFKKQVFERNNKNLKLYFGIGVSTITTNARNPFYSGQEGENKYEFISSILIAPGFDYTFQFENEDSITIGINYQYSPYKTEGALQDNIGSSGFIPRILYSF